MMLNSNSTGQAVRGLPPLNIILFNRTILWEKVKIMSHPDPSGRNQNTEIRSQKSEIGNYAIGIPLGEIANTL